MPTQQIRARGHAQAYPLSPMQGGMLFQSLLAEGAAERGGYDIEQLHIRLHESLDAAVLGRAFTLIARRHAILSTSFRWEGVERPEQVLSDGLSMSVETLDWTRANAGELTQLRTDFLARDRKRGFDLRKPPLLRATLSATSSGGSELFWTFHHILLDGRSFATVLLEVFAAYEAFARGAEPALPPAPRPYGDYIEWLARHEQQHKPEHDAFFKTMLRANARRLSRAWCRRPGAWCCRG
jgi:Condensation domain